MLATLPVALSVMIAAIFSWVTSLIILKTRSAHVRYTSKGHAGLEVQSMHEHPTPRIGGVAVALGLTAAACVHMSLDQPIVLVLLAAMPVFFAGLAEDIGLTASPRLRLAAAATSAALAIYATGASIQDGVAPGLDDLLKLTFFSAILTVFSVAALCHAFNLIDGMNGLASTMALAACASLGAISYSVGDAQILALCAATFAATTGVLLLNYPFGKLFLGDAGAYSLGFVIGWIGVLLIHRHPEISVWAVLLCVFLPFADTTAAILRRIKKRAPIGQPDKLHYHHIVKRVMDQCLRDEVAQTWSNPLATLFMQPVIVLPAVWAVFAAKSDIGALLGLAFSFGLYFGTRKKLLDSFKAVARSLKGAPDFAKPAKHPTTLRINQSDDTGTPSYKLEPVHADLKRKTAQREAPVLETRTLENTFKAAVNEDA
ncbi:MraY family glycosyltransferase [Shimia haliotis]|uniref:UDP-N-acetylmuramyl pentapeptide phosphotransferase/UDP-N-acetylglucosamine-1-phosphate transferase n=1 Tax=Shimia haliotis TaxID=1280847 RepID=A0A1I4DAD7_9RHOB|nr:glycosyltransferase [Shimia haliotis]SFK89973.1 UDP-N-acetylmuramyl pentapeptide phosphotransferase/UDP-N-acetylglucosamine-1-phosphate transferase [Shimia haliotis]